MGEGSGLGFGPRTRETNAFLCTPYPMVLARIKLLLDRLQVRGGGKWEVWGMCEMCGLWSRPRRASVHA